MHTTLLCLVALLAYPIGQAAPSTRTRVLDSGLFQTDDRGRAIDGQVVQGAAPRDRSTIAILPDRTTGADWGLPHLERAVEDLRLLRPDAVFCVGDLVQGYTRDLETWDAEADDYLQIVARLDADFWPTAGNHDVISGSRDSTDRRFADRYRERFGPLHYAVQLEHGTIVVLFSDENLDGGDVDISDAQIDWLIEVLQQAPQDRPIVVLMHRPLWRIRGVDWAGRVHPHLVEHGVDAVVAGHFHALHRDADRDGIQHHVLGVCGGAIDQHPLTGQFNHLTLLDLGPDDTISIRHLPVGVVLPDDFILRDDQDRAYRLKSSRRNARIAGSLPDPWRAPVEATVELSLRNPIDRPVTFAIEPASTPRPWLVDGRPFHARTEFDIANPATTDLRSPFQLDRVPEVTLDAGESRQIPLRFTAGKTDTPPPPPELIVTATFIDDHDRRVPVRLPRRVTIERSTPSLSDRVPSWPIAAWQHSVYEEPEPLGHVRTDVVETKDGQRLSLDVVIYDDALVDDRRPPEQTVADQRNPHGDLVKITIVTATGPRIFLVEPAVDPTTTPTIIESHDGNRVGGAWKTPILLDRSEKSEEPMRHELRILIPEIDATSIRGLQVEVADNDRTYHTQWRRLSPSGRMLEVDDLGG